MTHLRASWRSCGGGWAGAAPADLPPLPAMTMTMAAARVALRMEVAGAGPPPPQPQPQRTTTERVAPPLPPPLPPPMRRPLRVVQNRGGTPSNTSRGGNRAALKPPRANLSEFCQTARHRSTSDQCPALARARAPPPRPKAGGLLRTSIRPRRLRDRGASSCIRMHQASALAPVLDRY